MGCLRQTLTSAQDIIDIAKLTMDVTSQIPHSPIVSHLATMDPYPSGYLQTLFTIHVQLQQRSCQVIEGLKEIDF